MSSITRNRPHYVMFAAAVLLAPNWLSAAKPPPPPPPPPGNPFEIYEDRRADLGGWLDTERNLIWGYSCLQSTGSGVTYSGAQSFAQNYADRLTSQISERLQRAADSEVKGDANQALGDQALADGDLALADYYYARADAYYALADQYLADAAAFADAADVAGQYGNWRIPSKDEALDAVAKGLFTYGEGGFNSWDSSPATGMQDLPLVVWTNELRGTKAGMIYPADGSTGLINVTSSIDCIVVRMHVP